MTKPHQVDLGQVEALLMALDPSISNIVLVTREGVQATELLAFVTPRSVDIDALAELARTRLPPTARPTRIVPIATLPLTEHGEIDRSAIVAICDAAAATATHRRSTDEPIAVIGMGCRFPGAPSPTAFWQLMIEGRDAVGEVGPDRWPVEAYYDPDPEAPGKMPTRRGGFIDDIYAFDPHPFGISPREAAAVDPQHRLLLEVAYDALAHGGIEPAGLRGSSTGVFVGICASEYALLLTRSGIDAEDWDHAPYLGAGTNPGVSSGRLSYLWGLTGPSLSVNTACSSSLVATHLACQSLRLRECSLALAGGVNAILTPEPTVWLSKARMLAPDGRCKTFDAAADGYVRGEGCGMVALKLLSTANKDGDRILAVIRGSAVNHNGRSRGLSAPAERAQQAVARAALARAGVRPHEVGYVEAHGTGTALGDPVEARALGATYGGSRRTDPLLIGSVKTNIGHLEGAAGVAGLIKTILVLCGIYNCLLKKQGGIGECLV